MDADRKGHFIGGWPEKGGGKAIAIGDSPGDSAEELVDGSDGELDSGSDAEPLNDSGGDWDADSDCDSDCDAACGKADILIEKRYEC